MVPLWSTWAVDALQRRYFLAALVDSVITGILGRQAMEPVVHLRAAVCLLDRFPALAGVDLDVDKGEVVLLRGPNGAGKTTLLRALSGLVPIIEGQAIVLGHDLRADNRSIRSAVGLLGHSSGLYEELSVAENVSFWTSAARGSKELTNRSLERVGLDGRLGDVAVSKLSAGQRRRASLAVLIAKDRRLWLLDEPHAGLDAPGRDLLDVLVRDAATEGRTIIFASHELDRAVGLADRTVMLAAGQARLDDEVTQGSTQPDEKASEVPHVA